MHATPHLEKMSLATPVSVTNAVPKPSAAPLICPAARCSARRHLYTVATRCIDARVYQSASKARELNAGGSEAAASITGRERSECKANHVAWIQICTRRVPALITKSLPLTLSTHISNSPSKDRSMVPTALQRRKGVLLPILERARRSQWYGLPTRFNVFLF